MQPSTVNFVRPLLPHPEGHWNNWHRRSEGAHHGLHQLLYPPAPCACVSVDVQVRFVREGCKRAAYVNTFTLWVPKDSSNADEAARTAMCAIIRQAFPEGPEPTSNHNHTAYVQVFK